MVAAVLIAAVPAVAEVVVPRVGFIELRIMGSVLLIFFQIK